MSHVRVPHRSNRSPRKGLVKNLVRHNLPAPGDDIPGSPCVPCTAIS